jgi:hypothetical protein
VAGPVLRTRARFPDVARDAGHYESFYVKASHPTEPLGVWVRYTVHKRPLQEATGSVWFTLFDAAAGRPYAAKETLPAPGSGPDHYIHVGDSRLEPGRARGHALEASWQLEFESSEDALFHLPRAWMYRAGLPRTKLLSPYPAARFSGRFQAGARTVELDGWPGMVGHNWGTEHAERWIWMHGAHFDGPGGEPAWLDVALGRLKLGPLTTPWLANGVLSLDGVRHRLGGPERAHRTRVDETPRGCEFVLPGRDATVRGHTGSDGGNFVGWIYADPDGSEHHTVNCSIADMTLTVERKGRGDVTLALRGGAAYELGMRERDHGMEIQAFRDG